MEENREKEPAEQPQGYVPRPLWQIWAARVGLVVFILLIIAQIIRMLRGTL